MRGPIAPMKCTRRMRVTFHVPGVGRSRSSMSSDRLACIYHQQVAVSLRNEEDLGRGGAFQYDVRIHTALNSFCH